MSAHVTVITVTHNSEAVLPAMLGSIPEGVPVIVVDNASRSRAAIQALCATHGARLVALPENLGFGAACNAGAALAETEFLLFLNPDASLSAGALEALIAAARTHPEASAMNPAIREADGTQYMKRGSVLLPKRAKLPNGWPDTSGAVPILTGAALFVSKARFDQVGGFDEAIFLYHEDDDLALRLKALGPLMFIREAEVTHHAGHGAPRTAEVAAFKAFHMGRSRVYTARKHGVPMGAPRALLAAVLQMLSPLTLLSKRKRAKHLGFLRGVLSGLKAIRAKTAPRL